MRTTAIFTVLVGVGLLPTFAHAQWHDDNWRVIAPLTYGLGVTAATGAEGDELSSAGGADGAVDGAADLTIGYGNFSSRLATGGRLRAGGGVGPSLSGDYWFYLRPYEIGMCRFEIDYRLDWQAVPRLSNRRDLWRRPYTREEWGGTATVVHYQFDRWGFEAGRVRLHFATSHQQAAPEPPAELDVGLERTRFELIDDWTLFSLRRRPDDADRSWMALDLAAFASTGVEDGSDVAVASLYPLRARHLPIGATGWEVDGALAWSFTAWMKTSGLGGSHSFDSTTLPAKRSLTGNLGLRGELGPATVEVGFDRDLYLTFDNELARDERLSTRLRFPLRRAAVSLEGFAAQTELFRKDQAAELTLTGGGLAEVALPLAKGWQLGLSGELARGFYGPLDRDARPTPELSFRASATLSRRFEAEVDLARR